MQAFPSGLQSTLEWSPWPGIASFPCRESQHILDLPWSLSRGAQVWPWFNTLSEEWHFCWSPAPFSSLLHQCRSQPTSLISPFDFVVWILFRLSFQGWSISLQCCQSLGYPKHCLCPSLGLKYSIMYRKTEFALVKTVWLTGISVFLSRYEWANVTIIHPQSCTASLFLVLLSAVHSLPGTGNKHASIGTSLVW